MPKFFEGKKDIVVKLKLNCISLLSFWCNIGTPNFLVSNAMIGFFSSLTLCEVLSFSWMYLKHKDHKFLDIWDTIRGMKQDCL